MGQRVGGVPVPHLVERVAAELHDRRRLRGDRRRQLVDRGVEPGDRYDPGDETDPLRLCCINPTPGEHELERLLRRHRPHQRHRDHVRPQADVDLRRAELRVVGGDDEVARQRQAHAAGQRVAEHPGDRRLAQRVQVEEQVGSPPRPSCSSRKDAPSAIPPRSAPAQNALSPAPVSTTTRTSGSALATASASRSSAMSDHESALRRSGRSSVRRHTPSATDVSRSDPTSGEATMSRTRGRCPSTRGGRSPGSGRRRRSVSGVFIAVAIVVGVLVGLLRGGRFANLGEADVPPLAPARPRRRRPGRGRLHRRTAPSPSSSSSYVLLIAFCAANLTPRRDGRRARRHRVEPGGDRHQRRDACAPRARSSPPASPSYEDVPALDFGSKRHLETDDDDLTFLGDIVPVPVAERGPVVRRPGDERRRGRGAGEPAADASAAVVGGGRPGWSGTSGTTGVHHGE